MTRRNPSGPLVFDSEIESTASRNCREARQSRQSIVDEKEDVILITEEMDDNQNNQQPLESLAPHTMFYYTKPTLIGAELSIVRPTINTKNFEIKPNRIQMVQQYV